MPSETCDRIAVLICALATEDEELVSRALRSSAIGLQSTDCIYLLVDGAESVDEARWRGWTNGVPVRFHYSANRVGLAAGLNKLIDSALDHTQWTFFARMDADDECLPSRFDCQRHFLIENPHIDILGARCREVDENGAHLRTKRLPQTHDCIVSSLPKRNPLNHPTVMIRRSVFESGLRYRTDVGLVEDWCLWVDAAAAGFRFANLDEVVLNFRRGTDFFNKRGGRKTATAEWHVRRHARKVLHKSSPANFCYAVAASSLRLMPAGIQAAVYKTVN